ncbi:hypothetical protein QFZ34_003243 [Phyllobacterium ifriqiyense]|uniref:Antitoxin VbhA domain-containing protein n=1 Tax=Phyllobacterium ifriqiyense TaxID=314238 RepID=A0ABU0SC53_9HYPH|nr:hypothetical protein [Phyllobacterium ifriqiyense]MDQ0998061.1 hypothetical protein [Phyllobacterium ifriqiyense]
MSIASPRFNYEDEKQREAECREAMKDQFLDRVSSKDMYAIHQEAIQAGWGLPEVERAIDALVLEKAKESGKDLPC